MLGGDGSKEGVFLTKRVDFIRLSADACSWVKESHTTDPRGGWAGKHWGNKSLWDGVSGAVCKNVIQEQEITFQ